MFAIKRTTASDPRLVPLVAALDADLRARYGEAQDGYAPMNLISDASPFVIALDAAGVPVGCATFRPYDATSAEVKRMFVAPVARRRGLAAQILTAVEAWAREEGFATAILETGIHQHEAIALYHREGYADTEPFGNYVGMSLSLCMRKTL